MTLFNLFGKSSDAVARPVDIVRQADEARDARRYAKAAELYELAVQQHPDDVGLRIQCGHMCKESGALADAERHYKKALESLPDDADLALQLGHFYKVAGRIEEAYREYKRANELDPKWAEPRREIAEIEKRGFLLGIRRPNSNTGELAGLSARTAGATLDIDKVVKEAGFLGAFEALAPEIAPRHPAELYVHHEEGVRVLRFGRGEATRWGHLYTMRGVEALRGYCVSEEPIVDFRLVTKDVVFHQDPNLPASPLRDEKDNHRLRKYVFNVWCDFSLWDKGRYEIDIVFTDVTGRTFEKREYVVVADPFPFENYPKSDGAVPLPPLGCPSVDDFVNGLPSMARSARRCLFDAPPKTMLVMRLDQLGDFVASVPALRRLRQLFPDTKLVGLINPANVELEASLGLFDEVVAAQFADDPLERRRVMTLGDQVALRKRLHEYKFDVALDLSASELSRPILRLSGARFLYGFRHNDVQWLSADFDGMVRDPINGQDILPHTTKIMGLIEWFGMLARNYSSVARNEDLTRADLAPYGLEGGDKFVLMHAGARLWFSRWPHYLELATMLLERTDFKVVMISDTQDERANLPDALATSPRFQLLDRKLPFREFDALISFCSAFVGNDTGPKHLASLRGAQVVAIHMARNVWSEWGQENSGVIFTRRVPCAGCSIHHEPEECGKDYACVRRITPQEVFDKVLELAGEPAPAEGAMREGRV